MRLIRRLKKTWSASVVGVEFVSAEVVGVLRRRGCCTLDPKHEIRVGYDAQEVIRYLSADCGDAQASESFVRLGGGRTCGSVLGLVRQRLAPGGDGAKAVGQLRNVDSLLGDLLNSHAGPVADAGRAVEWAAPAEGPSVWLAKIARHLSRVPDLEADWAARTIGLGSAVYIAYHEGRWRVASQIKSAYGSRSIRDQGRRLGGGKGPCVICADNKHYQVLAAHYNGDPHKDKFVARLQVVANWLNARRVESCRSL